ncbi:LytR/AlgR family response regulator transcription factor [Mucilaginibacter sp. KACC 22063]|uniref:LytR/AlgR family response regulator transcription factor n=1 Tax=Mucilaginibacter sp. KACC 22063 TaxID=3025666 RepID=UPI0023650051|nr:LytTR family DNA-binding domain-containing protein [Mucilaginibacter sp. KACC 22063]WDF56029.1 LytTR family DNA-binding domain-containing protein [Mucilaginibacter sp. KACC 22063]
MESSISCVVIDDEPLAQDLIEKYIGRISSLNLLAKCENAIDAIERVSVLKPDLIFLDVNMPEMTGIEFIKTFSSYKPLIVLTTAYPEYAVDGYELDVLDFILKPITFERFVKAINKVKDKLARSTEHLLPANDPALTTELNKPVSGEAEIKNRQILFKENKKFVNVSIDEIHFVEGMKDYLKIHTSSKVLITHMTMTKIEEMLPQREFLRVNRSFIVRKSSVKSINGNTIELITNEEVPIGIRYREAIKGLAEGGAL